jgi:hypothetical protein
LIDGVRYKLWTPPSEDEFETVFAEHAPDVFGDESRYSDFKHKLASKSGSNIFASLNAASKSVIKTPSGSENAWINLYAFRENGSKCLLDLLRKSLEQSSRIKSIIKA